MKGETLPGMNGRADVANKRDQVADVANKRGQVADVANKRDQVADVAVQRLYWSCRIFWNNSCSSPGRKPLW